MKRILVKGPALSQSGYGEHTRFVLRSLRTLPEQFDIYLDNINWGTTSWLIEDNEERRWMDHLIQKTGIYMQNEVTRRRDSDGTEWITGQGFDISIQVTIPQEWEKIAPINIGVTAGTETDKISPKWVEKSLMMNKIVVVSEHSKSGFIDTVYDAYNHQTKQSFKVSCTVPVDVINFPIKDVTGENIDLDLKHDFNFLVVATWIPRKNLENTIEWFVQEFKEQEVGLVLKVSTAKQSLRDRRFTQMRLKNILSKYPDRQCSVYLLHGDIPESQMVGLYNHPKIKCLISLSHGEGFGLPIFEAACNGLPIITPAWGGQLDYLYAPTKKKKTAMFTSVAHDLKPIQPEAVWQDILIKDSQWCFPKEWSAKKSMRALVKNYNTHLSKSKKLQKWIKEEFSEDTQYKKMCGVVYEHSQESDFDGGLEFNS
jgi:glycosyltransferase involved in cell wall biosynthesis